MTNVQKNVTNWLLDSGYDIDKTLSNSLLDVNQRLSKLESIKSSVPIDKYLMLRKRLEKQRDLFISIDRNRRIQQNLLGTQQVNG